MTVAAAGSALSPIRSNTRWWAELHGTRMIPVARRRGAARMPRAPVRPWDAGQAVLVYPEGTIVPAGQTCPGRRQPGCLAVQVPVLPLGSHSMVRLLLEAGCGS